MRWLIVSGLAGFGATHDVELRASRCAAASPRLASPRLASLQAHAAYLAALPDHPAPADIIPKFIAINGKAISVGHAVLFRAHDLQAPPAYTKDIQD